MKKIATLALLLCMCIIIASLAQANTAKENWCGTYFEQSGRGYIRLAREDFGIGSQNCEIQAYLARTQKSGSTNIAINFERNKSTFNKWRKFHNHLIEIRGKLRNGQITDARFIRDMGI